MLFFFAGVFFVLAFVASATNGCTCIPTNKTYADFVCQNPMVVRAIVLTRQESPAATTGSPDETGTFFTTLDPVSGEFQIPIRVVEVFRNAYNFTIPSFVLTPAGGGMCGQEFSNSEAEYLILGHSSGGSDGLRTDMCRHNAQWRNLAPNVVEGLKSGRYASGCRSDNDS